MVLNDTFTIQEINLNTKDTACNRICEEIYEKLTDSRIEVLYDETEERPGAKFAKMDLIGLPWKLVVGPKGLAEGRVELSNRRTGESQLLPKEVACETLIEVFSKFSERL